MFGYALCRGTPDTETVLSSSTESAAERCSPKTGLSYSNFGKHDVRFQLNYKLILSSQNGNPVWRDELSCHRERVKHHPIKGVNETDTPLTVKKLFTVGRS